MTYISPLQEISDICTALGADVRYSPEYEHLTVLAWESEGEQRALSIQHQIQQQAAKHPGLICYCFDPFSTLVYVTRKNPGGDNLPEQKGGTYNGDLFRTGP